MPFDPTGLIPVAGAIGSAALQQHYALKNWKRTNEYNSPKSQVARLKEAKLPLATMFGGSGGSTSSAPSTPNVDPTLGTAEGLRQTNLSRFQRKQMEMVDQQIREQTAKADIAENERDFLLNRTIDGSMIKDTDPQYGDTNLVQGFRRERALKEADLTSKGILNQLQNIDLTNAPEKIRATIDSILASTGLTNQQIAKGNLSEKIATMLLNGENGIPRLKAFINAFIYNWVK